jgi:hypothetical protein
VLTVATVPLGPTPGPVPAAAQMAMAPPKPATTATTSKTPVPVSGLRHGVSGAVSKASKPVMVAGLAQSNGRPNAITVHGSMLRGSMLRGSELSDLRSWERMPASNLSQARTGILAQAPSAMKTISSPVSNLRMGDSHAIGIHAPLAGWMGASNDRRPVPVKVLPPMLPRITR